MTKKNYTHVVLLIDRSGSMLTIKDVMESSIKELIVKQHNEPGDCTLSAYLFDGDYGENHLRMEKQHNFADIKSITSVSIVPNGWTPLYDALAESIRQEGDLLAKMLEQNRPEKVIYVAITDGLENHSKKNTASSVKQIIDHQTEQYKWLFMFLGSNQDAILEASKIGIALNNSMTYSKSDLLGSQLSKKFSGIRGASVANYEAVTSGSAVQDCNFDEEDRALHA